jgi:GT2 family glycosyltransferase
VSTAVVIVNHNTREHLRACLASLDGEQAAQTVVVDNASTDGSAEMVAAEFPAVDLIRAGNEGFGAGANRGVSAARHAYVLLLNSDTLLRPGALAALEEYLDRRPQVGIAGPRLINPDGSLQPSIYPNPGPLAELMRWTSLARIATLAPRLRHAYLLDHPHDREVEAGWLVGAALAVRKAAFDRIGGFDEAFFMYSEEVDLAYRMQLDGWCVRFTPTAEVVHVGGASTAAYRAAMMARLYGSMTRFYRKHYGKRDQALLRAILTYFMVRNVFRDRLRLRREFAGEARREIREDLIAWRNVLATVWDR